MLTWLELDEKFRDVAPQIGARIEYQWGIAGTHYNLMGGWHAPLDRFVTLARIAGNKLAELPPAELHADIMQRALPEERWYEALRHYSNAFQLGVYGEQHGEDGVFQGHIFTGTIQSPATASANVALQFSAIAAAPQPAVAAPAAVPDPVFAGRLNNLIRREYEKRGMLWAVGAFVVTVVLAALAL